MCWGRTQPLPPLLSVSSVSCRPVFASASAPAGTRLQDTPRPLISIHLPRARRYSNTSSTLSRPCRSADSWYEQLTVNSLQLPATAAITRQPSSLSHLRHPHSVRSHSPIGLPPPPLDCSATQLNRADGARPLRRPIACSHLDSYSSRVHHLQTFHLHPVQAPLELSLKSECMPQL